MSTHVIPPARDRGIQCWGDSMTFGTSGITYPWATRWTHVLSGMFRPARPVLNAGVGGETAAEIAVRQLAYQDPNTQINVIWAGRNGVLTLTPAAIVATIQTMVDHVGDDRYVVLTVPYQTDGTEDANDANGLEVTALNALIESTWPDNHLDIATALAWDAALRTDDLHLTAAAQVIVAEAVYDFIVSKGW
jgi:lysophospholipase L1-like esterase